ncbi:polysaccharide lyase [Roseiconus lacunae]|uniref:Polysaccharide lyase 14 domain-containing protein n=1 Tax=Roseiconus lacunae TaxID=2605694 RepID=A0ABT7PG32_9BACT|nr:hypothetical protein [Roseiconus lacunae]MDM4015166.1 hypothetical protein [Roseiconus lacunae]
MPTRFTIFLFGFASLFNLQSSLNAQENSPKDQPIFECDFDSEQWWRAWGLRQPPKRVAVVDSDDRLGFKPHLGRALRIRVDEGGHYGVSLEYRFAKQLGSEPEEIYFRYYLRLASDWSPKYGGKFPGIGGTYGRAGWGGRKVDGTDGWSARGLFGGLKGGKTPIGYYCYHADMPGKYGENWYWDRGGFPGLERNRWYCIEQYVKLNTPGMNDGVLRAWVDDQLVYEKADVRMRHVDELKIETVWINVYYGGSWTAPADYHLFIDDVAIGRTRIGTSTNFR